MIDHVSLGTHRYAKSVAFYQQVLKPLGLELVRNTGAEAAFGSAAQWPFFLYPVAEEEQVTAKGTHLAMAAPCDGRTFPCSRGGCPRRCAGNRRARHLRTAPAAGHQHHVFWRDVPGPGWPPH